MATADQEHWDDLKADRPTVVTYDRDGNTDTMTMVRGSREVTAEANDGSYYSTREADFIIAINEFKLSGVPIFPPQELDRITLVDPVAARTFVVTPIFGSRCYSDSGQDGELIRIHTKEI